MSNVMLANKYNRERVEAMLTEHGHLFVQEKMDGVRGVITFDNGVVKCTSRNGMNIRLEGSPLFEAFSKIKCKLSLDGELVCIKDGKILPRKTGNGIINKAIHGKISKTEMEMIHFYAWDTIDYRFNYSFRFQFTKYYVSTLDHPNVHVVYSHNCVCMRRIDAIFARMIQLGSEGIVIKSPKNMYQCTRVNDIIKQKAEETLDMKVIGWQEGTGKYKGMMGALVCAYGDITVNVGTGFTDEERKRFDEMYIVGKTVEVKYNKVIDDKNTGKKSLFLPVFVCVRFDK